MTGEAIVRGNGRGELLKLTGELNVRGDCEFESVKAHGAVQVEGLLSAETVEVRMHGASKAREIGGGHITLKQSKVTAFKKLLYAGNSTRMHAELIEGDVLDLEHTKANVVRGNEVRIGPGCEIGRVEYRRTLNKSKSAKIREEQRID